MEIFLPSPRLAVLSGHDAERNLTRVISPVEALQLVAKVMKVPAGAKPAPSGPGHAEGERFQRVITRVARS